jgi:hypothetical protein
MLDALRLRLRFVSWRLLSLWEKMRYFSRMDEGGGASAATAG